MLQYLLNATATWLISLLVFDLFLRRESYHGYNRIFLLTTFVLGLFLPLWQPYSDSMLRADSLQQPVERVITAKQAVADAVSGGAAINAESVILFAYLAGVAVILVLLLAEIMRLVILYRNGTKTQQDGWTIVETHQEHTPFSFLNLLFVCGRTAYSGEEWTIVLQHEALHRKLFHFADLLLLQLCRMVFWFHPLVYIYRRRLLMIHEYQADKVAAGHHSYGSFLVTQAVLNSAPSFSHSFNCSPIKNRIIMLTRTSSVASRVKMAVLIPLTLLCVVFFSKNSFSQKFQRNGSTVTYKGNKFQVTKGETDTIMLTDQVTGKDEIKVVTTLPYPKKMNGDSIYDADHISEQPKFLVKDRSLEKYIVDRLTEKLKTLADGSYQLDLNNVIVGKDGRIVYYEFGGIRRVGKVNTASAAIPGALKKSIDDMVTKILSSDEKRYAPGKLNGRRVVALNNEEDTWKSIEVKDHVVAFK